MGEQPGGRGELPLGFVDRSLKNPSVSAGIYAVTYPKDPCTDIVYTWALKLLYRNP